MPHRKRGKAPAAPPPAAAPAQPVPVARPPVVATAPPADAPAADAKSPENTSLTLSVVASSVLDSAPIFFPKPLIRIVVEYLPHPVLLVFGGTNWGFGRVMDEKYLEPTPAQTAAAVAAALPGRAVYVPRTRIDTTEFRDGIFRHVLKFDPDYTPPPPPAPPTAASAAPAAKPNALTASAAATAAAGTLTTDKKSNEADGEDGDGGDGDDSESRGVWSIMPAHFRTPNLTFPDRYSSQPHVNPPSVMCIGDRHVVMFDGYHRAWMLDLNVLATAGMRATATTNAGASLHPPPHLRNPNPFGPTAYPWVELPPPPRKSMMDQYAVWCGNSMYVVWAMGNHMTNVDQNVKYHSRAPRRGWAFTELSRYDTSKKSWVMDLDKTDTIAVNSGCMTVFGKWLVGLSAAGTEDSVYVFDTVTQRRLTNPVPVPPLPASIGYVNDVATVAWNGGVLLTGGSIRVATPTGGFKSSYRAGCWLWAPKLTKGGWIRHSLLQTPRALHGIAVMNNTVWVAGGRDEFGDVLDSVEYWDVASKRWRYAAPMPEPRLRPGLMTWN